MSTATYALDESSLYGVTPTRPDIDGVTATLTVPHMAKGRPRREVYFPSTPGVSDLTKLWNPKSPNHGLGWGYDGQPTAVNWRESLIDRIERGTPSPKWDILCRAGVRGGPPERLEAFDPHYLVTPMPDYLKEHPGRLLAAVWDGPAADLPAEVDYDWLDGTVSLRLSWGVPIRQSVALLNAAEDADPALWERLNLNCRNKYRSDVRRTIRRLMGVVEHRVAYHMLTDFNAILRLKFDNPDAQAERTARRDAVGWRYAA
jgi:hypothetical protein